MISATIASATFDENGNKLITFQLNDDQNKQVFLPQTIIAETSTTNQDIISQIGLIVNTNNFLPIPNDFNSLIGFVIIADKNAY